MAYTLRALIADEQLLHSIGENYQNAAIVPLKQGVALLLNTDQFFNEAQSRTSGEHDTPFSEFRYLPDVIVGLVEVASDESPIAYVEGEFFGGMGTQAAVLWREGKITFGPILVGNEPTIPKPPPLNEWPINVVLRLLGVVAHERKDEFDTVGLGAHRHTEEWISAAGG